MTSPDYGGRSLWLPKDQFKDLDAALDAIIEAIPGVQGEVRAHQTGQEYVISVPSTVVDQGVVEAALKAAGIRATVRDQIHVDLRLPT